MSEPHTVVICSVSLEVDSIEAKPDMCFPCNKNQGYISSSDFRLSFFLLSHTHLLLSLLEAQTYSMSALDY